MDMFKYIDESIKGLIREQPTLEDGISILEKDIEEFKYNDPDLIDSLEIFTSYKEFVEWFSILQRGEPISKEIIALNFGLFESDDSVQLYVSGSKEWNDEDYDWAANNDYSPEGRYPEISAFVALDPIMDVDYEFGVFLSTFLTVLFVINYIKDEGYELQTRQEILYITAGFDDGELFTLGKLTDEGLINLYE